VKNLVCPQLPNHRRSESVDGGTIGVLIAMVAMGLILPVVGARNEYGLAFVAGLLLAAVLSIWQAALWSG
jgi:hypothetical protein